MTRKTSFILFVFVFCSIPFNANANTRLVFTQTLKWFAKIASNKKTRPAIRKVLKTFRRISKSARKLDKLKNMKVVTLLKVGGLWLRKTPVLRSKLHARGKLVQEKVLYLKGKQLFRLDDSQYIPDTCGSSTQTYFFAKNGGLSLYTEELNHSPEHHSRTLYYFVKNKFVRAVRIDTETEYADKGPIVTRKMSWVTSLKKNVSYMKASKVMKEVGKF